MMEGGVFTLNLEGEVPPELTKKGKPSKKKSRVRPSWSKTTMKKNSTEKISKLRLEILSLFFVPYTDHDKYVVKLVKDEHNAFVLDGETALGDLGLSRHENLTVVISFIEKSNRAVAPSSRPRRQAAEDAKAKIPLALKNDEKRRRAERRANKERAERRANNKNKRSRNDQSSFSGMGVRLNDGKKFGRRVTPGGRAPKLRFAFPGIGRDLSESTPVLPEGRSVIVRVNDTGIVDTLLSAITAKKNPEYEGLNELWKQQQEEERKERKAMSRLVAVSTGNYEIKVLKSGSKVGDGYLLGGRTDASEEDLYGRCHGGRKSFIEVDFGNKIEGKVKQTETVELLSDSAVKFLVEFGHTIKSDSEDNDLMLRPLDVAATPSYFWSLVHHCTKSPGSVLTSVEYMLRSMQPNLDWSHLDRGGRSRRLSKKAKENHRQELSEKAKENHRQELEAQGDGNEKRVASRDASDMDWDLVTPSEEDEEGLAECIDSGELVNDYISILVSGSGPQCKNPRQLANADPEVLFAKLNNECGKKKILPPQLSSVKGWVDAAQEVALVEIMLEIVDGDNDVLVCLCRIGAASPWDLTCYEEESDFLAGQMVEMGLLEEKDKAEVLSLTWRAQRALTVYPWLSDFSSA